MWVTHPRHREIGHIGDLRWYRCPAPWLWASEYLLVRSQWSFQHHQGAWKLRPLEKCHQLGTSLGKTRVRGVSFITELTISIQRHLRGPGLSQLGAFLYLIPGPGTHIAAASPSSKCHLLQEDFPDHPLPAHLQWNEVVIPQL